VFPLLGRVDYRAQSKGNITFTLGIGIGGYVFHSVCTTTSTYTYVMDYEPWKRGDVRKNISRIHLTALTPGGEGSVTLARRLGPSVSLGITATVLVNSKIEDTWESSGYYPTDWDPAEAELITMKYGYEYGGMGWGLGLSLSF
jgi:hypothetical protein